MSKRALVVDAFCRRQFDKSYIGTSLVGVSEEALEQLINQRYIEMGGEKSLEPGYAPFCKHLFVPNPFASIKSGVVEITPEIQHKIHSAYEARTEKELAVLQRWVNASDIAGEMPQAKWLDVILYSREQIRTENAATKSPTADTDAPWGIISIKGQNEQHELPMTPITIMRNALGASIFFSLLNSIFCCCKTNLAFFFSLFAKTSNRQGRRRIRSSSCSGQLHCCRRVLAKARHGEIINLKN